MNSICHKYSVKPFIITGYKNAVIKGRVTYESDREEGLKTGVRTIVISSNLK